MANLFTNLNLKLNDLYKKIIINPDALLPFLIILVGLLSGFAAVSFKVAIHLFEDLVFYDKTLPFAYNFHFFYIPLICAFFSGLLLYYFFPESGGGGITQLKKALYYNYGIIPSKEIIGKFLVALLCIGGGMAVGPEGPTIFICGALGSWIGKIFHIKRSNIRSLVICGAAGGLSAAFNTPISGIMFALEDLIGNFSTQIIGSTIIACVLASTLQRLLLGNMPSFVVPKYTLTQPLELFFYLFVGLFCALLAYFFIKLLLFLKNKISATNVPHKSLYPVIGGLFIGICAIVLPPDITGFNYISKQQIKKNETIEGLKKSAEFRKQEDISELEEIPHEAQTKFKLFSALKKTNNDKSVGPATAVYKQMEDVMTNNLSGKLILFLLIYKIIAIAICFGAGVPGGIFAPTIFIGAMAGAVIGYIVNIFVPHLTADYGAYALVGMGAFFAAVMKSPITSILIIFEMTHNYEIILPLMLANMTSFSVSRALFKHSIYDAIMIESGIHLPTENVDFKIEDISKIMNKNVITLSINTTISEAEKMFNTYNFYSFPVVDENNKYVGILKRYMLRESLINGNSQNTIEKIARAERIPRLYQHDNLDIAIKIFYSFQTTVLPVLDNPQDNNVVGIITQNDIIKFYANISNEKKVNRLSETIDYLKIKYKKNN